MRAVVILLILSALFLFAESKAEIALRLLTAENARLKAESAQLQATINATAKRQEAIQASLKSAGAQRSTGTAKTMEAISNVAMIAQANAEAAQAVAVAAKADAKLKSDQVLEFERAAERTSSEFRNGQYASFAAIFGTLLATLWKSRMDRRGIIAAVDAGTQKSVEGITKANDLTGKIAASHEDMADAVRGMKTALEKKQDR